MQALLNDMVSEIVNYAYPTCILTFLLCIVYLFMREPDARTKLMEMWRQRKRLILFMFYFSFLIMVTVLGRHTTNPYQSIFKHMFFKPEDTKWNKQIIENILVFIPLVFFFLNAFTVVPRKPCQYAVLLSVGTSLFIELSQLIFWLGEFQFSDILYNTIGGLIGYGVWRLYCKTEILLHNRK